MSFKLRLPNYLFTESLRGVFGLFILLNQVFRPGPLTPVNMATLCQASCRIDKAVGQFEASCGLRRLRTAHKIEWDCKEGKTTTDGWITCSICLARAGQMGAQMGSNGVSP